MADNEDPKQKIAPVTPPAAVGAVSGVTASAMTPGQAEKPKPSVDVVAEPVLPKNEVPVAAVIAAPPASRKFQAKPVEKAPSAKTVKSVAPAAKAPIAKIEAKREVPAPRLVVPAKRVTKVAKDVKGSASVAPVPKAVDKKAAKKVVSNTHPFAGLFSNFMLEETTMDMSANFAGFQTAINDAQAKAKEAFEKSSSALGEVSDFAKGNVEAAVESGKIFAEGVQGLSSDFVTESRAAFEKMSGDIKELSSAKSPTDFFKLQGDLARKNFDTAVAYSSKNSEAMLKLFSDAFAPISGRVSIAVEKARSASSL